MRSRRRSCKRGRPSGSLRLLALMAAKTGKRTRSGPGTPSGGGPADGGEIERLYGLPLEQFTPARDELARALRRDGQREASAAIKALRKPNLPAWALNQAQRRDPERAAELLRAGAELRAAQQRVVAGGDRGELREAAAAERRLVDELVASAEHELAASGRGVNASLQGKLRATAHAAAVTDEPGGLLAAGRLVRDYELSDLGLIGAGAPPVDAAERKAAAREAAQRAAAERREAAREAAERRAAERRALGLRRQLDRARARVAQLEAALAELEHGR
jgi:hypothetical protein